MVADRLGPDARCAGRRAVARAGLTAIGPGSTVRPLGRGQSVRRPRFCAPRCRLLPRLSGAHARRKPPPHDVDETHVPAQPPSAPEGARFPSPVAHACRTGSAAPSPTQGSQAPRALLRADRPAVAVQLTRHGHPRAARVRTRADFERAYGGRKTVTKAFVLFAVDNGTGSARLGVTATRRLGKAVVRNRARRRLREAFRQLRPLLPGGYDYVLVARRPLLEMTARQVELQLLRQACAATRVQP